MDSDIRDGDAGVMSEEYRATMIRPWRVYRDRTLEDVAAEIGMTASHLSMVERGERGVSQKTLAKLARALKAPDVASLIGSDPHQIDELWALWKKAAPKQREQIVELAKVVIKTGT